MEVPIAGSDAVQWIQVHVPHIATTVAPRNHACAPPPRDASGSFTFGGPSDHVIWRVHKDYPNMLQLMELSFTREPPKSGLHIVFQDSLSPFACIFKEQTKSMYGHLYLLYAITTSGFAYLIKLKSPTAYKSGSVLASSELIQLDISKNVVRLEQITALTAAAGILCIGGQNGSILCHQLGQLDVNAQDFSFELKDGDAGLGRLWGLVARGKTASEIRSLETSDACGKRLLFALHGDGNLRIWDLVDRCRIFSHCLSSPDFSGFGPRMLYVGEANANITHMPVAVLYRSLSEVNLETILLCNLNLVSSDAGGRQSQSLQQQKIPLDQGKVIDVKLSSDRLWVLKEGGSTLYDLFHADLESGNFYNYNLQEAYIENQLLQGPEYDVDDLILAQNLVYSSIKNEMSPSVSTLFLRRLLQPGIRQRISLQEVLEARQRHLSDSEFRSLTIEGLRKEILTVIDSEGDDCQIALSQEWKNFCSLYIQSWCHNNVPYSFFFNPSTGGIGLIRRHSLSVCRELDDFEQLVHGMPIVDGDFSNLPAVWRDNMIDSEILHGVLKCTRSINRHLGKAALAVFYEGLIKPSSVTFQNIVTCFLRILDTGYEFSFLKQSNSHVGLDTVRGKEHKYHNNQRKFSLGISLSLQALRDKAGGWDRVLDVIEKYLKSLIPENISLDKESATKKTLYNVNTALLVQSTSQVAEIQFEGARDLLLLLGHLVKIKGQVNIEPANVLRIQLELVPSIQDIAIKCFLLHWMCTTSAEAPPVEDFSSQLSLLHIVGDGKKENRGWEGRLGTGDLTLAGILLFGYPSTPGDHTLLCMGALQKPNMLLGNVRKFVSWIFWGGSMGQLPRLSSRAIALSSILLQHGQYGVLENLFITIDEHSRQSKLLSSIESVNGEWHARLHLLGFCLLARARLGLEEKSKEKHVGEAICCFFRAASGEKAGQALQELSFQMGLQHSGPSSAAAWKLHYFEWVMQIFDQHNLSAGARQFAHAALEQVDEACGMIDCLPDDSSVEVNVKGRLWANVFKFSMDLEQYREAYCAIISNPDEESKFICLRRFIIVLCERRATQILCDCELPFVGLLEKVERELIWKAECSDITAKPNPYKLLYAFYMYRQNWRRAAGYIYRYTVRLKEEGVLKVHLQLSFTLQERLQGLTAAINALHLVDPAYAWVDFQQESTVRLDCGSPSKRARTFMDENSAVPIQKETAKQHQPIDMEQLENEYVLTLAHLQLAVANVKHSSLGGDILPSDLVVLLVQSNLFEMAFTVIFKFWRDSSLKRELEKVVQVMAQKCCTSKSGCSLFMRESPVNVLLIPSSAREDQTDVDILGSNNFQTVQQTNSKTAWHVLQLYLEKYKGSHSRLPVVAAETLLCTDPQIELPLWLVDMFKGARRATAWGMAGQESDPAALFRLYIEYGRFSDATHLLLEYLEAWASLRPADIIKRKKMSAVWFPYTSVERLYGLLSEMRSSGQMMDQCDSLQKLLHGAMLRHLKQMKVDSDDVKSSAL